MSIKTIAQLPLIKLIEIKKNKKGLDNIVDYSSYLWPMVHGDAVIAQIIRLFAEARGISLTYSSFLLTGSGTTLKRIDGGGSLTSRRAAKITQRASNHWPAGLAWPAEIPRPERSEAKLPKEAA